MPASRGYPRGWTQYSCLAMVKSNKSVVHAEQGHRPLNLDFTEREEVLQILPSAPLLSSLPGQLASVHLDYYHHPAAEIPPFHETGWVTW